MRYNEKYSLRRLLFEQEELPVPSTEIEDVEPGEATEEEEIAVLMALMDIDLEEIEAVSDGPLPPELTEGRYIFEVFPRGSTQASVGRPLPKTLSGSLGSITNPTPRPQIKLNAILKDGSKGKILLTTGRSVGDTWVYSNLLTIKVTKIESVIASDGLVYDGVPAECEYTISKKDKNGNLVPRTFRKITAKNRWAEIAIEASGRKVVGDYYEEVAETITGGKALGGSGNADIIDIPLVGGVLVNAECGGFGKVSQLGGVHMKGKKAGKTKPLRANHGGKELHHERRIALGFKNATKNKVIGTDRGGDSCALNQKFTAPQSYAYWTCSLKKSIPKSHQEHLLIAADATKVCIYALKAGLKLQNYPNATLPQLTPQLCGKELKLVSSGQDGDPRFAPSYRDINWSKALCFDIATGKIIKTK